MNKLVSRISLLAGAGIIAVSLIAQTYTAPSAYADSKPATTTEPATVTADALPN
jgi:hypothetical protein